MKEINYPNITTLIIFLQTNLKHLDTRTLFCESPILCFIHTSHIFERVPRKGKQTFWFRKQRLRFLSSALKVPVQSIRSGWRIIEILTLKWYSKLTRKGNVIAWRIFFSFSVCSTCLSFTTCNFWWWSVFLFIH